MTSWFLSVKVVRTQFVTNNDQKFFEHQPPKATSQKYIKYAQSFPRTIK